MIYVKKKHFVILLIVLWFKMKNEELNINNYKDILDKLDEDSILDKCIKARKRRA